MCVCVLSGSVMDVCVQVEWACHGCVCVLSGRVMDVCVCACTRRDFILQNFLGHPGFTRTLRIP